MSTRPADAPPIANPVTAPPSLVYHRDGAGDWITAADNEREWMSGARNRWPYRCLPLTIANAHGWWLRCPEAFSAEWRGDPHEQGVAVVGTGPWSNGTSPGPKSHFGEGIVTFNLRGRFETGAGWGLWITGAPNHAKHGLAPLSAFVRTDRLPFTFTMNWRFTAPGATRFEVGEPFCHVFPVPYGYLEGVGPLYSEPTPEYLEQRRRFSAERDSTPHPNKRYHRGVDMDGGRLWPDRHTTLKLREFA